MNSDTHCCRHDASGSSLFSPPKRHALDTLRVFSAAIELIAEHHDVTWLNIHPYNDEADAEAPRIADADFVLVRSDWLLYPTQATDRALWARPEIPVGPLIAGSTLPPSPEQMRRFDVIFYETPW